MNIYFSCSITGGRQDQDVYAQIVEALIEDGHEVPTAILSRAEVMEYEAVVGAEDVYRRDVNWVEQCDAVVAEVSTPSHGVGYEIALALMLGKPVLCCYHQGRKVSKMILGNTHATLRVAAYHHPDEAVKLVQKFINELQAGLFGNKTLETN